MPIERHQNIHFFFILELACYNFLDAVLMDIQKKIRSAFEIFDHENNQTIDVRFEIIHLNNYF